MFSKYHNKEDKHLLCAKITIKIVSFYERICSTNKEKTKLYNFLMFHACEICILFVKRKRNGRERGRAQKLFQT